jgi:predicted nucleic acid-binding protein
MTTYIDSSALLRHCFNEGDVTLVQRALHAAPAISALSLVEVPAAIHARYHRGTLGAADRAGYLVAAETLLATLTTIGVTAPVRAEAIEIASRHLVRALDAIQVATATLAARRYTLAVRFCTADIRQAEAARAVLGDAQVDFVPPLRSSPLRS